VKRVSILIAWTGLASFGCALPDQEKNRCDTAADCLGGYACAANVCQRVSGISPQPEDLTTWTDSAAGFAWLNPVLSESLTWQKAATYCAELVLDGQSDFRLPTISELRSLVRGCDLTLPGGACRVSDSCTSAFADCAFDVCSRGCTPGVAYKPPVEGGCFWDPALNQPPFLCFPNAINCHWSSTEDTLSKSKLVMCFFAANITAVSEQNAQDPLKGYTARCVRKLP